MLNMKFLENCLLFIIIESVSGQIDDGSKIIDSNKTAITINCNSEIPKFYPKTIEDLTLNCSVLIVTYADFLKNLQITSLKTLKLNIEPSKLNLTLNSTLFENLNVTKLIIDYKFHNVSGKVDLIQADSDFLYILNEVEELEIHGVAVVENKEIETGKIEPTQCARLQTLRITASNLRLVPSGWLRHCKKLKHLHLSRLKQRNATKEVRRKVLTGAKSLRKLEILDSYIEELEDELAGLDNLEILNVAHNQIHYALTTIVLPNLVELDLSYNHLYSSALLATGMEKQPKLRALSLDFNTVLDICDNLAYRTTVVEEYDSVAKWHNPLIGRTLNLNSLQWFSLRGTITTDMCFGGLNMNSLEYFDLSDSKISAIDFQALPVSKARRLEVNVSGCPIKDIPGFSFNELDYKELHHEELRISGLNVTLLCDCDEYFYLAKASRERRLILSGALCANGQDLMTVSDDQLRCSKYRCGNCTCRRYWQDNSTDVECNGKLDVMPKFAGIRVRRLNASENHIQNVSAADFPDSLIYLDLSKNQISRMSEEDSKALFKNPERRVRFYGNPIICDCENQPFIKELMDHFDRVEDYAILMCIDDGRLIQHVDPFELCFNSSRLFYTVLVSCLGALIGIVALVVGVYYRFGKAAKVYLFSKGLCLFCIRENEIDADRKFDAFVSFSHKDEEFVTNDLLPGLENEPYKYKLCVHYRNWIAGELIPAQINQSIKSSKRTIVVLSKAFLDSLWGLLEFRAAHLSALKEGRNRLIIIIIDDILETGNLDGELRTYLRTNTYVKWGDPWFWDQLRFALPHRPVNTVEIKDYQNEGVALSIRDTRTTSKKEADQKTSDENSVEYENKIEQHLKEQDTTGHNQMNTDAKAAFKDEAVKNTDKDEEKDTTRFSVNQEDLAEINKIADTKETAKDLNKLFPVGQISTDSAIEMDNYE